MRKTLNKSLKKTHKCDSIKILILSCYKRIIDYEWHGNLKNFEFHQVYKYHIKDYYFESELKENISSFGNIQDDVSLKMKNQYESFPLFNTNFE